MIDVPRPLNGDFLIFESINKTKGAVRTVHLLIPGSLGKVYKMGRGHEADVKIIDISVSRLHAKIKLTQKGFVMQDNNSKFGILVQIKNKATYRFSDHPLIQYGRTRMAISVRKIEPIL
eukprot:TRINITY_DN5639_c0_g1_i8.p1 TRINITY_DN5639_c0_g1~~TRINITY_DN5639_c0_g1_i8.p1  ORF type:complete len:119 (-),score=15.14 TRINITY_DN5639_c0_g1_i8:197-553(-)